jgi:hypothetical protein
MQFSLHERQRKLQELSVADRIILNTVMAIVSSSWGRRLVDRISGIFDCEFLTLRGAFILPGSFLMIYLGCMHFMVFSILYYAAHHVQHGCDPALDHVHT